MADDKLKRIHTFQSDVEELMQKEQVSKADIALAEGARQTAQAEAAHVTPPQPDQSKTFRISNNLPLSTRWNVRLITVAAVGAVVLGGIGIGVFFFSKNAEQEPAAGPRGNKAPETRALVLQGKERRAGVLNVIQAGIAAVSVPQNEMRTVPVRRGEATLSTSELFTLLETGAPPALVRALGETFTLGIHGFQGGQPFLLFTVSSYDHAFAGMLLWEPRLIDDVGPLFGISSREILADVGSTTTEALQNTIAIKDVIIKNKDARAAFNPSGSIVFLYSFTDKRTLIFTTSEDTLKALISKAGGGKLR